MSTNKIYVVGIGPGEKRMMTGQARDVLAECDVIIGYTVYIKLIEDEYEGKEFLTTPMTQEIERCRLCFEEAMKGKRVALVCSGDAGVYGMASLMYEIREEYLSCELEIVPGVTAAVSGAALLGAPINHDFCVISLSDRLTSWELIEKRLRLAVEGDFCIALYNPSSRSRKDYLERACEIMLSGASPDRVCGYVENIGRAGTRSEICTLGELKHREVNMFTTVFIGNSQTVNLNGHMVTKRGYRV